MESRNDMDECKFAVSVSFHVQYTGRDNRNVSQLQQVPLRANHVMDNEEWKQFQSF